MRPKTATIQVVKDKNFWRVEIGNPGSSKPSVVKADVYLIDALVDAVLAWKKKEGLDD